MQNKFENGLFIFRRDLRLDDNTGLNAALRLSDAVIACFIFDPRQVDAGNSYRSMHAIQFMIESIADIEQEIKTVLRSLGEIGCLSSSVWKGCIDNTVSWLDNRSIGICKFGIGMSCSIGRTLIQSANRTRCQIDSNYKLQYITPTGKKSSS